MKVMHKQEVFSILKSRYYKENQIEVIFMSTYLNKIDKK